MSRRILAIGGAPIDDASLTEHILTLAGVARPRVLLLPTASGDSWEMIARFHAAFDAERCDARVLRLFQREVADLEAVIAAPDVICVGGGNTANMLAIWRVHGVDRLLRAAYDRGTLLCGSSAGMNCWFEASITDSFGTGLAPLRDGLGLLAGSACPHYDSEALRRPVYMRETTAGLPGGIALDDGAAALFDDETLVEVVGARPGVRAFRVEHGAETSLEVRML